MALTERIETWIQETVSEMYDRWCNASLGGGGMSEAMADGLRAAYLRGRADERDGFVESGDVLGELERRVTEASMGTEPV